MAWEATFEIPVCSNDAGKWAKEDDKQSSKSSGGFEWR